MGPAGGEGELGGGGQVDVLIVSLGSTYGLRMADEQLRVSLERAGAKVALARARVPLSTRTLMLTDLAWARAARVGARRALAAMSSPPRAVIYSSTTAALLWSCPGAIRFDAPSAGNRPGRHGLWQRPLERRRLAEASLLLPWSAGGLEEAAPTRAPSLVLPVAVEPSAGPAGERDIAAVTYGANPKKKGLARVLEAWREVRDLGGVSGELVVAGISGKDFEEGGLAAGERVQVVGPLARDDFRALLRRARVYICAPLREDYGIAQLEALADGCQLVTSPAPGPYAALPIARELDSRLVGEDLAGALRTALSDPLPRYAERTRAALAPYTAAAVDELVAGELLPRLLAKQPSS
jgi:hypothetical protein